VKTLIFGDIHGKEVAPFLEVKQDMTQMRCLGDYDHPEIVRQLLAHPLPSVILPGNHDYSLINGISIGTKIWTLDYSDYVKLWKKYPVETEYIQKRCANPQHADIVNGRKIVYAHSCLDNGVGSGLWSRILCKGTKENIFRKMRDENYWILFRGHDHVQSVFSAPINNLDDIEFEENSFIVPQQDRLYIITVGGFFRGKYAVFDGEHIRLGNRPSPKELVLP